MLGRTSRLNSSHQNKKHVHIKIRHEIVVFGLHWKITFNNEHCNYVIFNLQLT